MRWTRGLGRSRSCPLQARRRIFCGRGLRPYRPQAGNGRDHLIEAGLREARLSARLALARCRGPLGFASLPFRPSADRSEEHTSELQSLMRISYAVFCLKKKKKITKTTTYM